MYIRLHVYNDGDTELTKVASPNKLSDDLFFDEDGETDKLLAELIDYGFDSNRASKAIKEALNSEEGEEIIA